MKLFRELRQALIETRKLQTRYHVLTSIVGLIGAGSGFGLLLLAWYVTLSSLGIDSSKPITATPYSYLLIAIFLLGIPVVIYLGTVVVASLFSAVMIKLGKFTREEAIRYSLYSRYPKAWFRKQ